MFPCIQCWSLMLYLLLQNLSLSSRLFIVLRGNEASYGSWQKDASAGPSDSSMFYVHNSLSRELPPGV